MKSSNTRGQATHTPPFRRSFGHDPAGSHRAAGSLRLKATTRALPEILNRGQQGLVGLLILLGLLVGTTVTADADEPGANSSAQVGANLDVVIDYSTEVPFVDLFKSAREWIPQQEGLEWGAGPALKLAENGQDILSLAPGQYATTLISCGKGVPAGRYTCLYEGQGTLEFEGQARVVGQQPGRLAVDIQPPGEILLNILSTDAADPVRNIRIIMPGHEETYQSAPFYPLFLQQKSKFSVLRFMEWQKTNDSEIRQWSDRPRMEDPSQADRGVAIGWMVALANTVDADPWFCMPHLADDDYVRRFAEEVRETLEPERKVYIEYSNEVWNGIFPQHQYAKEQGAGLNLAADEYLAGLAFYSQRSVEIFSIWEAVFGGTDRLVRVLGGQGDYPAVSARVLAHGGAGEHADALAIGAYFGHGFGNPESSSDVGHLTVDDAIQACRDSLPELRRNIEANALIARRFQLPLIAYEGGQHLRGIDGGEHAEQLTEVVIAANRDMRMKTLYADHLADWKAAGGQLYVAYKSVAAPSQWGAWGLLEYEGQRSTEAPKSQAIEEYINRNSNR